MKRYFLVQYSLRKLMAAAEDALSPVALFLYASKNCEDVLVWKSLDCCRWY